MARRTLTPATPIPTAASTVPPRDPSLLAQSEPGWSTNLLLLRRQWKWAAFSQFFYTFATLLATGDVALSDIEDDLARSTALYLPRIMHRLLYTLTQDRKITIDTWQMALRKQYMRRDPGRNPIGPEPKLPSRHSTPDPSTPGAESDGEELDAAGFVEPIPLRGTDGEPRVGTDALDEGQEPVNGKQEPETQLVKEEDFAELEDESKDWLELSMLEKLDSLHLLTEWQFQNPQRLRAMMKDDDEDAQWRIDPIGYDAKTNAYWLIGPDRLWIQRVPPKPPKGTKRKRTAAPSRFKAKASTSKLEADEEEESDSPQQSPKRKRVQPQASGSRPTRSHKKQTAPTGSETGGKSTRAAKLQAKKKLDAQAKELAEFQRQVASLATSSSRSTRQTRGESGPQASPPRPPPKTPRGTRASARLRGPVAEEEDEWQQIPEEWLAESADVAESSHTKDKGKRRVVEEEFEQHTSGIEGPKTGLESDGESSELSDLPEDGEESGEKITVIQPRPPSASLDGNNRKARSSKRLATQIQAALVDEPSNVPDVTEDPSPEAAPALPDGFVEWEAICVTLYEWEHITERFEKATHYLEKALFKVLSQRIVPAITAELKESERKRRIEEAIVHRKRSSRIALKESEKEEARITAKKKAEESEKLARAKRAEARMKKEEVEREKRERGREQRRIEREEREQRALAKQQRADGESGSADIGDRESTATPAVNGMHSSNSVHLSRVATPSGVRTPDWILDCEICHASGMNVDDGQPMVSCGICSKWQHINCHNLADLRQGRPKRNWETQQFYCKRCRVRAAANGASYAVPQQQPYVPAQQYPYSRPSSSSSTLHLQRPASGNSPDLYSQSTSDIRYLSRQPVENGTNFGQQQYSQKGFAPSPAPSHASNGALTFAHYQPDQRGFSIRTSQQLPVQPTWSNGYAPVDNLAQRPSQSSQYMPQHSHNGGAYASNGISNGSLPAAYQQQGLPVSHVPSYAHSQDRGMSSNAGWSPTANGYTSGATASATQSAAESLAYMQELANGRHGGWQPPHAVSPHVQSNGGRGLEHGYPGAYVEQHQRSAAPSYHYPSAT